VPATVVHLVIWALGWGLDLTHECGVQKLMKENLKVVWVKFSTLSLAVLVTTAITWNAQACPHQKLKFGRPGFVLLA